LSKSLKSPAKGPHFFCENCGVEVPRNAEICPQCGRSFASVRCPACNFIGRQALFKGGCPVCGYSSAPSRLDFPAASGGVPEIKKPAGGLPVWVYILTAAAFLTVLAALFFSFFGKP